MSFKNKPQKHKYIILVNTLDELHSNNAKIFNDKKKDLELSYKKIQKQKNKLEVLLSDKNNVFDVEFIKKRAIINNKIETLTLEINDIENGTSELEYYSKTSEILLDYYNIIDNKNNTIETNNNNLENNNNDSHDIISDKLKKINLKNQSKKIVKKNIIKKVPNQARTNSKNILSFFTSKDENEIQIEKTIANRASLCSDYLNLLNKTSKITGKIPEIKICEKCNQEKIIIKAEGVFICKKCGEVEKLIIESEIPNHRDITENKKNYPYRRINHFNEWLNRFQAKETIEIPKNIYDKIIEELIKQRIQITIKDIPYMQTYEIIKKILSKIQQTRYYEHIAYIMTLVTGNPPLIIPRDIENEVKEMFKKTQIPFTKLHPNRKNFLNYSYVLHQFFRLLELDNYAKCFTLLKSKSKLRLQEEIWKEICYELEWKFHASV
jgi:hypothetical protein